MRARVLALGAVLIGALLPALPAGAAEDGPVPVELGAPALELNVEPIRPIPLLVGVDPAKRALGRQLFFDKRLSSNGQTSCGDCHALPPIHDGVELQGVSEPLGDHRRSVPLLYNVAQAFWLNWDGSFYRLEDLLAAAIPQVDKMNLEWREALSRIRSAYGAPFAAIYGGPVTQAQVVEVLATFLRSLNAPNARFDRYLQGDHNALSEREQQGYRLFKQIGCTACHNGTLIGTNFFEQFYIYRHEDGAEGESRLKDQGRYYYTAEETDRNVFRVPSLRNVALTAPYFHDGSAEKLEDAVEEMIEHQLGLAPDPAQVELLVGFLRTLTGTHPGERP